MINTILRKPAVLLGRQAAAIAPKFMRTTITGIVTAASMFACPAMAEQQVTGATSSVLPHAPERIYEVLNRGIDSDNVYRIELLVFKYRSPDQQEYLAKPTTISYPQPLTQLSDLHATQMAINSLLFEIDQYEFDSLEDFVVSQSEELIQDQSDTAKDQTLAIQSNNNKNENVDSEKPIIPLLLVKDIDPQNTQLKNLKKRLDRRGGYQVLQHSSWYQALESREVSVPIAIQGGKVTQGRYELEGTIKISRDRFLHVEPHFWLTSWQVQDTPMPWYMSGNKQWQIEELPEPEAHPAIALLQQELDSLKPEHLVDQSINEETSDNIADRYRNAELLLIDDVKALDGRVNTENSQDLLAAAEAAMTTENEDSLSALIPATPTSVHQLHEKRRLKRGEVHYFDHPLFGAVIVVSRLPSAEE